MDSVRRQGTVAAQASPGVMQLRGQLALRRRPACGQASPGRAVRHGGAAHSAAHHISAGWRGFDRVLVGFGNLSGRTLFSYLMDNAKVQAVRGDFVVKLPDLQELDRRGLDP